MLIPPGGGPPPHRHDFEELFHVLEGEIEVTLRGTPATAADGQTVNVLANAPHAFRNATGAPVRLPCLVSPAGLEEYFAAFGAPVATRPASAPPPDEAVMRRAVALAASYRIENL